MKQQLLAMTAIGLLFLTWSARPVHAQEEHRLLAQQLLTAPTNAQERNNALAAVAALPPKQVGPDLRTALFTLLEQEGKAHEQQYEAARRHASAKPLDDPEFIGRVSRVVINLRDPRAIPALTEALSTGPVVSYALASFGEQAAPALIRVASSPDKWYDAVDGALMALRFMVEGVGGPLSSGTLKQIGRTAEQRLNNKQYFTTLWTAIDLAASLKDSRLREIVRSLSVDVTAVIARGIEEPDLVERTQRRAAERLAGAPALPRPETMAKASLR